MTYWTLEFDGTEKQLADWGIGSDLSLQRFNQAADVLRFTIPGAMDGALAFAYGDEIIIRRDRTSADGTPDSFSDGSTWFTGFATVPQRLGSGSAEAVQYQFNGPWWQFERLVFQQSWKVWSAYVTPGDPGSGNVFVTKTSSELFLGQQYDGTPQNTGAQVSEALDWAITCGVDVQIGTLDPAVNIVSYNVRDITVAEAIIQMLRWSPDVVTWFDYTTTPPTFHARSLANLTEATATVGTEKFRSLQLRPRYDLQLPAVFIRFKSVNSLDGASWVSFTDQTYPPGSTGQELGAAVHTIELAGTSVTTVNGHVQATTVDANSGTAATRLAWWQKKLSLLASTKLANVTVSTPVSVLDDSGSAVSLSTLPRELGADGQIADWMGFTATQATIKATVSYDRYADDAHTGALLLEKVRNREISVRVNLTDAVTGDYSTVSSYVSAEDVPSGLAQSIYDSYAALQYEGQVDLVGNGIPDGIGMGNKLTIAGTSLTLANILIQSTTESPFRGTISLQIGPPAHLGLADLIELLRVNRYRRIYNLPAQRSAGTFGGSNSVGIGRQTAKENSIHGLGDSEADTINADAGSGALNAVQSDAGGNTMPGATSGYPVFAVYRKNADGSIDTSFARMIANLADLTGTNKEVKFRQWDVCVSDGAGGTISKKAWFLSTEPEDP